MSKTRTSLNEDSFFRNYGEYKSKKSGGESEREYYYDDYEDYSEND